MGPALWYAYLSREPELIQLIVHWAESWAEAMRSTRHGKPAGIFPPVLESDTGSYLIGSDRWDKPQAEWDYFQWSGAAQDALTSLLLAVYDLTGEARWLTAAGESFQILSKCSSYPTLCQEIVRTSQAFFEWRRFSGDNRFDSFFGDGAGTDLEDLRERMTRMADETESYLSVNFAMLTSEAIFTDRVSYQLPNRYRQHLFGGDSPRGDRYPTFAVTWPSAPGEFARLVVEASRTRLKLLAYNFEAETMEIPLRVWRLQSGPYIWEIRSGQNQAIHRGEFIVSKSAQLVEVPLPPQAEVSIELVASNLE